MEKPKQQAEVIPLFGRDEMNMIELPFGPISAIQSKTIQLSFSAFDPVLKREVDRSIEITGSEKYGLPQPIDDQVLIGMKTLTHEAGYDSRKIAFSGYHLCRTIGWDTNGRAYERLEKCFDRILTTSLKFKDAWWDKGNKEWKSDSFHLIDNYSLCSRDVLDRARLRHPAGGHKLSDFVWNEVIWKSLKRP